MLPQNFAIVDVETTGGSSRFHRIIEIGILRVEKGELVRKFETLLNPGVPIPEFITQLTGIRNLDVVAAPTFDDIKDDILELFEGAVFVAHNAGFDYGFIKNEFELAGYGFTISKLCTVRLSRALFPEHKRHNLSELIRRFDFTCKNRHRALDDAKVLWDFLQLVDERFPQDHLDKTLGELLKFSTKKNIPRTNTSELEYVFEL